MWRCTPIREVTLATLGFELLVGFEHGIIHPVVIPEIFICLSIESTVGVLQRFFRSFDSP